MTDQEENHTTKNKNLEKVKELEVEIAEAEKLRNEYNEKVKQAKAERDAITKELKALQQSFNKLPKIARPDLREFGALKAKYRKLDWAYQTGKFSMQKEKELVKELDSLESQILSYKNSRKEYYDYEKSRKKLIVLQKKALKLHKKVLEYAKESEKYHNKLKEARQKIREFQKEKRAFYAEKVKRKKETQEAKKELNDYNESRLEKVRNQLVEKAKEIMNKFKKGEKITSEELQILQETELR